MLLDDVVFDVACQFRVLEKKQMRVEDVCVTTAKFLLRAVLDSFELASRQPDSRAKTSSFALQIRVRNVRAINVACALLKTQHTTDHDALRNPKSLPAQLVSHAKETLAVNLFRFVEVTREETDNCIERFLLIVAVGNNFQVRATTRSQCQDAQNRLRIRFGVAV